MQLGEWIDTLMGNHDYGRKFVQNDIEGWMLPSLTYSLISQGLDIPDENAANIYHSIQVLRTGSSNLALPTDHSEILNGIYRLQGEVIATRKDVELWMNSSSSAPPTALPESEVEDNPTDIFEPVLPNISSKLVKPSIYKDPATRRPLPATHFVSLGIWAPRLRQV